MLFLHHGKKKRCTIIDENRQLGLRRKSILDGKKNVRNLFIVLIFYSSNSQPDSFENTIEYRIGRTWFVYSNCINNIFFSRTIIKSQVFLGIVLILKYPVFIQLSHLFDSLPEPFNETIVYLFTSKN